MGLSVKDLSEFPLLGSQQQAVVENASSPKTFQALLISCTACAVHEVRFIANRPALRPQKLRAAVFMAGSGSFHPQPLR